MCTPRDSLLAHAPLPLLAFTCCRLVVAGRGRGPERRSDVRASAGSNVSAGIGSGRRRGRRLLAVRAGRIGRVLDAHGCAEHGDRHGHGQVGQARRSGTGVEAPHTHFHTLISAWPTVSDATCCCSRLLPDVHECTVDIHRYVTKHADSVYATGYHMLFGGAVLLAALAVQDPTAISDALGAATLTDAAILTYITIIGGAARWGGGRGGRRAEGGDISDPIASHGGAAQGGWGGVGMPCKGMPIVVWVAPPNCPPHLMEPGGSSRFSRFLWIPTLVDHRVPPTHPFVAPPCRHASLHFLWIPALVVHLCVLPCVPPNHACLLNPCVPPCVPPATASSSTTLPSRATSPPSPASPSSRECCSGRVSVRGVLPGVGGEDPFFGLGCYAMRGASSIRACQ